MMLTLDSISVTQTHRDSEGRRSILPVLAGRGYTPGKGLTGHGNPIMPGGVVFGEHGSGLVVSPKPTGSIAVEGAPNAWEAESAEGEAQSLVDGVIAKQAGRVISAETARAKLGRLPAARTVVRYPDSGIYVVDQRRSSIARVGSRSDGTSTGKKATGGSRPSCKMIPGGPAALRAGGVGSHVAHACVDEPAGRGLGDALPRSAQAHAAAAATRPREGPAGAAKGGRFVTTAVRWERLRELFDAALALQARARSGFLAEACPDDPDLRLELASLIAAHEAAGDFLQAPALHDRVASARSEETEETVGSRIGPYEVLGVIGSGGMGVVYRARRADEQFEQHVAIKVVRRGLDTEVILRRFRAERQILARLNHPGIARLLDGGSTQDGRPFFIMEHIEGQNIDVFASGNGLDVHGRLELFRRVCAAVHYAHQNRVVHRDIKPGNILVTPDGAPKLLDFGIAKILDANAGSETTTGLAMTPEYASPEQLRGEAITPATDVYSLGVLLYELLVGQRPYRLSRRRPEQLLRAICDEEPERPSAVAERAEGAPGRGEGLCGDLDAIVLTALRKEPLRRYPSAEALSEDVHRHLVGRPVVARRDSLTYRVGKTIRRNRTALAWVVVVACLTGAAVAAIDRARLTPAARRPVSEPFRAVPFTSVAGREQHPAFSPDGTRLAYDWSTEKQRADVYVQAVEGGAPVRLTTHADDECCPVFSHDGRQIAFLRFNHGGAEIVVVPATGGAQRSIARVGHGSATGLDWSPDGRLAVVDVGSPSGWSVFAASPATGERTRLTVPADGEEDTHPRFSPDGRMLAFLRQRSVLGKDVFVLALDGGATPHAVTSGDWQPTDLAWTPDGRTLVFSASRPGQEGLWRVDLNGGAPEPLRLTTGLGRSSLAVSRQGHRLAYAAPSDDVNIWRVGTRHGQGAPAQWIASTRSDTAPHFSRDGRRIAFDSGRSGSREIWVCAADGSDPVQVTSFGGPTTGSPRWSPDGRQLAFDSYPRGSGDVFVLALGGGTPRSLVEGPANDVVPSWSRDGSWVYFASDRDGGWRVWKVPATGGAATPVSGPGGFAPLESPDGRFVYFARRSKDEIWRVPVAGGAETRVEGASPAGWGSWTLSAGGLYFVRRESRSSRFSIEFLPFGSPRAAPVATLERPPDLWSRGLTASPDGRWLLYPQYDLRESDIVLVENFH